ncbi:hypothetical protein [Hymenobacter perfusus]|uniref:Uncharacterized protein n=1 Tax=Hymenobacter perfusus TaxID=1236770 RepID=A0A428KAR6_9BACT|nr:hypothetical protein [Hymenobacter perfusus]RSK43566.1 hypothetical protein EI293_11805 [Hymenobacter perfusus]
MHNDSTANSTQLVRYQLQLSPALEEPHLIAARTLLTEHGFVVDQLTPDEVVVASTQGTDPDWQPVREGFQQLGSAIAHITTAG